MHKNQNRPSVIWFLAAVSALCVVLVAVMVVFLILLSGITVFSHLNPVTTGIGYPSELLDGHEDRLADLVVGGLPLVPAWEYQAPSPIDRPPTYHANHLVLKSDKAFWLIDAGSGAEKWKYEAGSRIFAPSSGDFAVVDTVVAFQTYPYSSPLHAIDLETGQDRWQTLSPVRGFDSDHQSRLFIALTNKDRLASEYQALDATTGRVLWVSEVHPEGRGAGVLYDPSAHEVYVRDDAGTWVILDDETGRLQRSLRGELFDGGRPIMVSGGVLYCEDFSPYRLFAVDSRENRVLWMTSYPSLSGVFEPVLFGRMLYAGTRQDTLLAIDRYTGELQWQYPPASSSAEFIELLSNLVVLDNVAYGIFSDARLRGFDATTGQEVGYIQFVDASRAPNYLTVPGLAASEDMLFVSLGKTRLYAFKAVP